MYLVVVCCLLDVVVLVKLEFYLSQRGIELLRRFFFFVGPSLPCFDRPHTETTNVTSKNQKPTTNKTNKQVRRRWSLFGRCLDGWTLSPSPCLFLRLGMQFFFAGSERFCSSNALGGQFNMFHFVITAVLVLFLVVSLFCSDLKRSFLSCVFCPFRISRKIRIHKDINQFLKMSAAEIDAQVADYREIQGQIQRLRGDLQLVLSQETENTLVEQELNLIDNSTNIYKMVGPVLIKHSLDDAKDTVSKRLEFIKGEKKRLEDKISELETRGQEKAKRIQQMQSSLQQATAAAVNQIRQEAATAATASSTK